VIYAFAQTACENTARPRNPSCQMVSAEQAARLDADNAVAWINVAAQAAPRREPDAVAAAMHRASVATRIQDRTLDFLPLALAALPAQASRTERGWLVVGLVGVQAALPVKYYSLVSQYCNDATMADGNRRQTCAALAERLVANGSTLLDLDVGRRIGERAGWPRERLEGLSARREAYQRAMLDDAGGASGDQFSCDALDRLARWWDSAGTKGERAAAEEAIARAGLSDADLVARYREQLRQRAQAAAPASAASGPR
jgi:hypothetical protein